MPGNRNQTGRRKANRTSFRPGRSGNPSGRPKLSPELKAEESKLIEACREKTLSALTVIEQLMYQADRDSVKLAAASFIIERGWGKAVQPTELSGKDGQPMEHNIAMTLSPSDTYLRMVRGS